VHLPSCNTDQGVYCECKYGEIHLWLSLKSRTEGWNITFRFVWCLVKVKGKRTKVCQKREEHIEKEQSNWWKSDWELVFQSALDPFVCLCYTLFQFKKRKESVIGLWYTIAWATETKPYCVHWTIWFWVEAFTVGPERWWTILCHSKVMGNCDGRWCYIANVQIARSNRA